MIVVENEYVKVLILRKEFPEIGIGKVKTALTEAKGELEVARFYLTTYSEGLLDNLLAIHATPNQEGRKLENMRKAIARTISGCVEDLDTRAEQEIVLPEFEKFIHKTKEERNLALMRWLQPHIYELATKVQYAKQMSVTVASELEAPHLKTLQVNAYNDDELLALIEEVVKVYNFEKTKSRTKKYREDDWYEIIREYFSEVIESLDSLAIQCHFWSLTKDRKHFVVQLSVEEKDIEKFKYLALQGAKLNE